MHNVHLILVRADSADQAANIASDQVVGFGHGDNWYRIGGIASEDGCDDQNDHEEDTRYSLSWLDDDPEVPREGTYFARAVWLLRNDLSNPPDIRTALASLADELRKVRVPDDFIALREIVEKLKRLFSILYSRHFLSDSDIPEFRPYEFDQFGLTATEHVNERCPGETEEGKRHTSCFWICMACSPFFGPPIRETILDIYI